VGKSPIDDAAKTAKDAAYVSVGLGVLAFQRLQVRRQELKKALAADGSEPTSPLGAIGALVGGRLRMAEERIGAALNHE
jgi:hypothetical protein